MPVPPWLQPRDAASRRRHPGTATSPAMPWPPRPPVLPSSPRPTWPSSPPPAMPSPSQAAAAAAAAAARRPSAHLQRVLPIIEFVILNYVQIITSFPTFMNPPLANSYLLYCKSRSQLKEYDYDRVLNTMWTEFGGFKAAFYKFAQKKYVARNTPQPQGLLMLLFLILF